MILIYCGYTIHLQNIFYFTFSHELEMISYLTFQFLFLFIATGSFFVKHVKTGMCINDTRIIFRKKTGWNQSFVELSQNCLNSAAQFRFRDNGAMFNLKTRGCLVVLSGGRSRYYLEMFYLYVNNDINRPCYQAISQTCWGGLSTLHNIYTCAVPKTYEQLAKNQGIDPYIALTNCNNTEDKHFNLGKFF